MATEDLGGNGLLQFISSGKLIQLFNQDPDGVRYMTSNLFKHSEIYHFQCIIRLLALGLSSEIFYII